ncbi:MAG: acylneuraminate cytidylyltransferase [Deltaproteobacteria bacterium]|nr:MAG: acylneuraminate cytidylyltransferase [Deltaproteobacteria bacterium]
MNTVAIIQARMSSTRLPGKVMKKLVDRSVLAHVVNRLQASRTLDAVVVATTDNAVDDVIAAEARRYETGVYRGSEADVLGRYRDAAREFAAEVVVRITSDCPLLDPELVDLMVRKFFSYPVVDYLSNTLERTYPRGLDVEIFTRKALETAFQQAHEPFEREHVTPYIYQHEDVFSLVSQTQDIDHSNCRWTLDTADDWQFMEAVYGHLYRSGQLFTTADVLELLRRRPEIGLLNVEVRQKKLEDGH